MGGWQPSNPSTRNGAAFSVKTMLYVSSVRLENVRCFGDIDLTLSEPSDTGNWTVIAGDNATGKSTLLRAIAMGLCDESSAAGLMKESDEGYVRRGYKRARITIRLRDPDRAGGELCITTEVIRESDHSGIFIDRVRQTTFPEHGFPWYRLFVSGYGAGRGVGGAGDVSAYSPINAVYNMFNYTEGLQNPELVMRRLISRRSSGAVARHQLVEILCRATRATNVKLTSEGIRVDGPWGEGMPLRDLADGYKSAFLWITDLIGWALAFQPKRKSTLGIRGIVIVDELEQHLHARWQRTVVDDLKQSFPNLQFVVSTHSPLVASSIGAQGAGSSDKLYVLEAREDGRVEGSHHQFMQGWNMDQVLASRAFRYQIQADPSTERMLRAVSEISQASHRTPEQERLFQDVKNSLKEAFLSGKSPIERIAELEADEELMNRIEVISANTSKKNRE